jgi:16S rRNA (uracil1498-N3)-methyltransferase
LQKVVTNFYSPPEYIVDDVVRIKGEEARHIARVLRHKKGEIISVVDGAGVRYKVALELVRRDEVEGRVIHQVRRENEPVTNITLAAGISTGAKMDLIIEKGTELGVRKFIPVYTEQATVELDDPAKTKKRFSRWNKVAIAAMKQSLRSYLPKIEGPVAFTDLIQLSTGYDRSLVASLEPGAKNVKFALESETPLRNVLLLVGPESGFTAEELEMSKEKALIPVKLGPRRLRTETACITLCSLVLGYLGELE